MIIDKNMSESKRCDNWNPVKAGMSLRIFSKVDKAAFRDKAIL